MPTGWPFRKIRQCLGECSSSPVIKDASSIPRSMASFRMGYSGVSVVTCVVSAKFLTRPQDSPSGVSDGQSMPQWEGCKALGPEILRVFSNWELILVIIPSVEIYESLESTWVMPYLSILNLFKIQFPVEIAFSSPRVIWVELMKLRASKGTPKLRFLREACFVSIFSISFLKVN